MNTSTGKVTDESGRPVRRYVDKRNWWVYDVNTGDTVGSARMNNNQLMYRGNNGNWESYDKRWTDDMDSSSSMNSGNMSNDNSGNMNGDTSGTGTTGSGHSKVKVKTPAGKMKATDKGVKTSTKE
jgi:hypothetical protein